MPKPAIWIKQRKLPSFVGTFYDVFIMTSPAMSPVSYIMLSSTAYAVTREYLLVWVPWLNYALFLGALVTLYLVCMLGVYTFLYASYFTHRNSQEYKHTNPIRMDIAAVDARIKALEGKVDEFIAVHDRPSGENAIREGDREE